MNEKELKEIPNYNAFAVGVWFDAEKVYMEMKDGRTVGVPLAWFPRLANATDAQRNNWEFNGRGVGVHWPDIDEDLLAEGMFTYVPKNEFERA
jgi:Protein of unknown function (DUF2442)